MPAEVRVPDLEFPWPDCSVCEDGGDMDYDGDLWTCLRCRNEWERNGQSGRPELPLPVGTSSTSAPAPATASKGRYERNTEEQR